MRIRPHLAWTVVVCLLALLGCAAREPVPQPRKVVNPAAVPGAVTTPAWDIAAVAYEYYGQGLDYRRAGLEPVYLVVRNKAGAAPRVLYEETRGMSAQAEYLPYTLDEATRLVFNSESMRTATSSAFRSGSALAMVGAGLGALLGTIGGGDNIWKGAVIGGSAGMLAGGTGGVVQSEAGLRQEIQAEMARYAWNSEPMPPTFTKVGYLYFPGNVGVNAVAVTIRDGNRIETHQVPVVRPASATPSAK